VKAKNNSLQSYWDAFFITEDGVMIPCFDMDVALTKLTCVQRQANFSLVPKFVMDFSK
jgi:hypothetical protein